MIYSDYNNDKFTEHDALSTALYLSYLPQIQRVFANVESLCTEGANVKAKHTHTHRETHAFRSENGWEWFYGKLLLNHSAVESFSQSSAGTCKMIHHVSLFPWPHLLLSAHWSCVSAAHA